MQLTFLGTSCMVPTKQRNVSGVFLSYKTEGILFDCGEGTQRQMNIAGIKRTKVTKVLISHWHGDHVSGLVGLIQTMGNDDTPPTLEIFGPKGTEKHMEHLMKMCVFESRVNLKIYEIDVDGVEKVFEDKNFIIEAAPLKHTSQCVGYSFIEKDRRKIDMNYLAKMGVPEGKHLQDLHKGKSIKWKGKDVDVDKATKVIGGKKISYVMDTAICDTAIELARDADVLICECAYSSRFSEKAKLYKHLTSKQAATIAKEADADQLYLTHFSQRFKDTDEIEEDAKSVFENSVAARDFMKVRL
ncbi:MAG: ribonuclease Z [Candidatus Woesearchaeota archaeon]